MRLALFGGTFDPVHSGHLAAAQEALKSFALDRILFVPARLPPHKRNRFCTPFEHRYAMVALACAGVPQYLPSLLEADPGRRGEPCYSITTVRRLKATLTAEDQLYFLIGADAFLDIPQWYKPVELLESCDFIIVSRPGFPIAEIEKVVVPELRGGPATGNIIPLQRTKLHLLTSVAADVSSSSVRRLAAQGKSLSGLVPETVADYIQKLNLFLDENQTE